MSHGYTTQEVDVFCEEVRREGAAVAARAARGAPPPSLEDVTLKQNTNDNEVLPFVDGGSDVWRVTRVFYGSGLMEIRGVLGPMSKPQLAKSSNGGPKGKCNGGSEEGRFLSSVLRSQRGVRERCMQFGPDHLLTLTKRGKFLSVDDFWKVFKEFNRLMTLRFGERWQYVCVPELHADGETYHAHCAVKGFYMAETVRVLWYRALGGRGDERGENTPGNIDLSPWRGKGRRWSRFERLRKLSGYIAKYCGKGFGAGSRGRRLFSSSGALHPDRVERGCVRHWLGVPELIKSLQTAVIGAGGGEIGEARIWNRYRGDGSLVRTGFVLSTEWRK